VIVVDADVLGRRRTGDETYVERLLAHLPDAAPDLRFAAVTRRPELVPDRVEPVELATRVQEVRMAWSLPRLLRRLRPRLAHFVHSLPLSCPCPAVLTIADVSFERDASLMGRRETAIFRAVVPHSARRAARVLTVSERTRRDVIELYDLPPEKVVVTRLGHDRAFSPDGEPHGYLLFVGAIEPRKDPLTALTAARALGRPLVVAGPAKDTALARELAAGGAQLRGYVGKDELVRLYRGAACLLFPTRYEGFGLPVLEAMASGTPVVATPDPAVLEVAGDAAVYAERADFPDAVRRALDDRDRLSVAGVERARSFSWAETARVTANVYREVLG
jgi:glycosyltransferase involved in cell wall biosynthesis